jgi:hypothetical protein
MYVCMMYLFSFASFKNFYQNEREYNNYDILALNIHPEERSIMKEGGKTTHLAEKLRSSAHFIIFIS